jgi:DNA modification methylase
MTQDPLKIIYLATSSLTPYDLNPRRHPKKQIRQIADAIEVRSFYNPILITSDLKIVAGQARLEAAKLLKMEEVPTICLGQLGDAERRALVIADNKLALGASWDIELLAYELESLAELNFDMSLTGFSTAESDLIIEQAREADPDSGEAPTDRVPTLQNESVTRLGDRWVCGSHVLVCGDAQNAADYERAMMGDVADLIITDPPYNCKINGHVSGLGQVQHPEFVMASGEMDDAQFTAFLTQSLTAAAAVCKDGTIAFVFMDWRGMEKLLEAGKKVFTEFKQLCVWNKNNGGMGDFYRSKHELVFVFKVGTAPHCNTFGLGDTGRYRTNVWDYPGISSFGPDRAADHARHPTPKPVALLADAIRDCTLRGEIVLDPFGGSGSTLIAAETCGRVARLIELDPAYCDVIVRRYEEFTGKTAILSGDRRSFEDIAAERLQNTGEASNG